MIGAGQAFLGPAAAGVIVAAVCAGRAIAIDGATYAVSGLCLGRLQLPAMVTGERELFLTQLSAGWTEFRIRTWLWVIVAQFGLFHLRVHRRTGCPAGSLVMGCVIAGARRPRRQTTSVDR